MKKVIIIGKAKVVGNYWYKDLNTFKVMVIKVRDCNDDYGIALNVCIGVTVILDDKEINGQNKKDI